ncbi:zinc-binding metallopeptidase family protein [Ideonella sp. BN130291]|uniref:zinc-binding metallopeptidase family protein n=1 Tax=Ideonella sp. BN130291 TaxID=3112940 RepID=UPI002E26DA7B|nr:putative zinc-binding metallopeptidase [Ideonella sp. BN130291]
MATRFHSVTDRLRSAWKPNKRPTTPRAYRCQCGRPVFFRNSQCLACGTALGYEPERGQVIPLAPAGPEGQWKLYGSGMRTPRYRRCGNFDSAAGCNWLIPVAPRGRAAPPLCVACRLNRTIPDLSLPDNQLLWNRIEGAKRRMVSQLIALHLPVQSKVTEDPQRGLCFDFLRAPAEGPAVMTGHADGVITLNIEEADDAKREQIRAQLHEPYRTLLGHFRHEVGHYYWDRLVRDSAWLPHFRALFGDEQQDYAAGLKANYEQGPPPDWPQRFVSSYASSHPWEDWAETWAHYLHMVDTVDTALSFGIDADEVEMEAEPWSLDALWRPDDPQAESFLGFLNAWVELTAVLNEMSRSMGQHDFYPFVLPRPAVAKLQFIHAIVHGEQPPPAPAGADAAALPAKPATPETAG